MPVYVDYARNPFGRMLMCHMVADSIDELMEMADRIGLARRHFQAGSSPHFDLSQSYRKKAVSCGAVEVGRRELVDVIKRYRKTLDDNPIEQDLLKRLYASRR